MGETRWSEMGLGRGIDGSEPSCMRAGALSVLVSPRDNLLEELRAGTGYKSFDAKILNESTLQRELTGSLDSGDVVQSVKLDFGIDSLSRQYEGRFEATAHGEQIHNRTIRFKSETFSPRATARTEDGHMTSNSYLEEVLQEKMRMAGRPNEATEARRIEICKRCIQDARIGGATHFISSLDLGAKIFQIRTASSQTQRKKLGLKANLGAANTGLPTQSEGEDQDDALFSLGVGFNESSMRKASVSGSNYQAIIHPEVQLNEMHTKIEPDQERTISFDLSPIALLIGDPLWREAMKLACKQYIAEKVAKKPARVGQEGPFKLRCGSFYLKEENNHVRITLDPKKASPFYIVTMGCPGSRTRDIIEDADVKFNLVYRTENGMDLFLCISSHRKEAVLRHIPFHQSEATFQLSHLCKTNPASLLNWSQQCLMLYRHTRFLHQRQFLAVVSHDDDLDEPSIRMTRFQNTKYMAGNTDHRFTVKGVKQIFKETKMPQFQLQNYTDFPIQGHDATATTV